MGNKLLPSQKQHLRAWVLSISILFVIAAGILSRYFHTGYLILDKYLGDALYAVLIYLLLSLVWAKGSITQKAGLVMAFLVGLELFQRTQIPYQLSTSSSGFLRIVAILLGTKFGWLDLASYWVGVAVIVGVELFCRAGVSIAKD